MLSENPTVVAIGTILDGKFRVTKEIGRGGMAAVYEAENVDIGKRVAVKVLSAELANSKVVTERFMREARAAAKIRSPYICDVYDVGTFGGRPFLVMELLEGESLYDRLARERRLEPKDVLQIANETAMGLSQAHEASIVHRDLKPENIFLARGGGAEPVSKIVDFGLAKFYDPHLEGGASARLTKEGALFGTPAYMSPEQASARGPIGLRSDLWALGCIVYEMLVGRTVWNVDQGVAMILAQIAGGQLPTPSKVNPALPKSFDAWFAKALDRDESRRFGSATELADALRHALGDGARTGTQSPTYTAFEATSADAFIHSRSDHLPLLAPPDLKSPVLSRAPPGGAYPSRMPRLRRYSGRVFAFAFAAIALGVVAAVAWVYVEGPPRFLRRVGLDGAPQPVEIEPYAQLMAAAQEQLVDGEFTDAIATFEHAFESGEKKAARSLRTHARVADESNGAGRCELRGLGHPRSFDATSRASRPAFARVGQNLIAAWVASSGSKQHAVYATRLDYALRRIAPEQLVTPEVIDAKDPQLLGGDNSLLLLYSDARGKESLVYGRELSLDGQNAGAAHLLNATGSDYAYDPALARAADGTHWVVYTQADDKRVHDLYLRHLDRTLAPLGPPVRITAYAPPEKLRTVASFASIEVTRDLIHISYRVQRGVAYQVMQLRISPDDPQLARGVERMATEPAKGTEVEPDRTDRFVGQMVSLSEETEVQAQPRITCLEAGCLTVWADDTRGAQAVMVGKDTGEVLWRKNFAAAGSRPSLGRQGQQVAVAWYEGDRVRFALVEGSSVAEPNVVGWVKGLQPYPEVVGGAEPGQWYISWRAYEAAIFEPFVARVDCN